ncbi:hypothetical protein K402DRAFT_157845 [Aulographum hederae CBS 113979]|uniref:Uncharacterized protein n=1 Tax=Aulographum hederae CBS 113979 TaxID=1176131 RepID=A0A6G1GSH1_9PEZI|nr:hypothetical protein K402DRAFT_157845 [Aulographum hederae CBS 113979]
MCHPVGGPRLGIVRVWLLERGNPLLSARFPFRPNHSNDGLPMTSALQETVCKSARVSNFLSLLSQSRNSRALRRTRGSEGRSLYQATSLTSPTMATLGLLDLAGRQANRRGLWANNARLKKHVYLASQVCSWTPFGYRKCSWLLPPIEMEKLAAGLPITCTFTLDVGSCGLRWNVSLASGSRLWQP